MNLSAVAPGVEGGTALAASEGEGLLLLFPFLSPFLALVLLFLFSFTSSVSTHYSPSFPF